MAKRKKFHYTAIIIGAGPAGLGTALALSREGIDSLVLESQDKIGLHARGETIRFSPEMEDVLYPGFFNKQTIHRIKKRRYYSHTEKNYVDRTISTENLIIEWPHFIGDIADIVQKAGAEIRTGIKVTSIIEENSIVKGIRAKNLSAKKEEIILADTVFSCGGVHDPGSFHLHIERFAIDLPIHKRIVRNFNGPHDRLEYYLHVGKESLPGIGCIFPRGRGEAEIILMPFTNILESPTGLTPFSQVETFVNEFSENHPTFKSRLEETETYYTVNTLIPMGKVLTRFAPRPGLVMVGDALGHVDVKGGSGIRTSFLLGYCAGKLGASIIKSGGWSPDKQKLFDTHMMENPQMKLLKRHALIYGSVRRFLFQRINDPARMDRWWPLLKTLLR